MEKIIIALDISTKPGIAIFFIKDSKLELQHYETMFPEKTVKDFGLYPQNYVYFATEIGQQLVSKIVKVKSDHMETPLEVIIEETNKGKNPYSQKILEFIHFATVEQLIQYRVSPKYIRTGIWRGLVGGNLNKEEKSLNAKISRIKKNTGSKLAKIEGKVVGRRTRKHAALRAFKEHFGFELPLKLEDACEACLLGLAYFRGAPICDGTLKGGTGVANEHLE